MVDHQDHSEEDHHHDSLIELGDDEYHAEVVHDGTAGSLTICMLDSSGKLAAPIVATELLINLSQDGQAEQFTLLASPQTSDPAGQSSRFASSDPKLSEALDQEGTDAQLVVTIGDKQYRGAMHHDHDQGH